MTITYDPDKLSDLSYTLGVLSSKFIEEFGEKAEEIVSEIFHQRGLALGKGFASKLGEKSFETTVKAFIAASKKSEAPGEIISLDEKRAVVKGAGCPFTLNGRGRKVCEAIMALDQGLMGVASGCKISVTVNRTLAEGDDHCEVVFEVAESL